MTTKDYYYGFRYIENEGITPEAHSVIQEYRDSDPFGTLEVAIDLAHALSITIELFNLQGSQVGWVKPGRDYRLVSSVPLTERADWDDA